MVSLRDVASRQPTGHSGTKPLPYYGHYEDFLNHHKVKPVRILEIGTFEGESTKILADAFPEAQILTLDRTLRPIDFERYPMVTYKMADQSLALELSSLVTNHFPQGVDLVIDDASHFGHFSQITFEAVFPHLVSGGAYFIEDWGTGYWDSWADGSKIQEFRVNAEHGLPKRIPSHDFGMVGFVKSLVDLTHEGAVHHRLGVPPQSPTRIKSLEFREGVCMLIKADSVG